MICTVDVDIQAANPDFPLKEWKSFKGSPTSIRIRNVPRKVGAWDITEVNVKCVYPDNTAHMVAAVHTGCVWVATIPASHAVGFVDGGYSIEADGTDERGNVVTGYRLGEGKVTILDVAVSAHAVDGIEFMRVLDTKPDEPRKGDFALNTMEIFDGAAWRTIGPTPDIGELTRVEPYLYEVNNATLDESFAEAHFRDRFGRPGASPIGACSCVRIGNEFARAYDWRYDESVSFLVRTKASGTHFASVAVCASPEGLTRQAVESKTAPANLFRIIPYLALDGINENGVTCCVNVVAANDDGASAWPGRDFCAVGAVRHVLDHARTAEEGATLIANGAWMPSPESLGGYSLHFMIADGSRTYVVEDGQIFDFTNHGVKAMTNFRVGGRDFYDEEGFVGVNKIAEYDPFGSGAERYDEIIGFIGLEYDTVRNWLTGLKYSVAYDRESTDRPSDFAGVEIEPGVRAKINDTLGIKEWFVDNDIHAKWIDRTRDGTFWQTVHSSVYDIAARSLQLVVQEGDAVHTFPLVKSDSEPADYPTVRQNAATGAAHAAETGNPHGTTAEQVGVRVVELVVEGDAKKLYLMFNGERTTERVTSYAALLAMAKRGLVRLYYNAVGGTGRKALYTPHMVDDDGTPAMRFDATGTLGEKVYTRSIALTKSGADGIAVTIGALTEIQKSLTSTQLENIDAVPQKRDKSDMYTEWEFSGKDAGSFDNLSCEYDKDSGSYLLYSNGVLIGSSESGGLPCNLLIVEGFWHSTVGEPERYDITAARSRILTTADVTDDLESPTEGKAADAAAVAKELAKKRDKTDLAYDAKTKAWDYSPWYAAYPRPAGYYEALERFVSLEHDGWEVSYRDGSNILLVDDATHYATEAEALAAESFTPTFPDASQVAYRLNGVTVRKVEVVEHRTIVTQSDETGELPEEVESRISWLAEAACADNPSASVASLEGRVVPCVSGASGTVDVSFAARKDGDTTLRFFDVLIKDVPSGGCQINLPPTESFIYGNALKAEEGWNHYSFAEFKDGDSYKWSVNRVKMSTSQS